MSTHDRHWWISTMCCVQFFIYSSQTQTLEQCFFSSRPTGCPMTVMSKHIRREMPRITTATLWPLRTELLNQQTDAKHRGVVGLDGAGTASPHFLRQRQFLTFLLKGINLWCCVPSLKKSRYTSGHTPQTRHITPDQQRVSAWNEKSLSISSLLYSWVW